MACCSYLVEVRVWLTLSDPVEVSDVDQLVVKEESCISLAVLGPGVDMRQVTQLLVAPVVQLTQATAATAIIAAVYKYHHNDVF